MTRETNTKDVAALFTQALNVMNGALARHKDEVPYKQIAELSAKLIDGRNIGVAVYDNDAKNPFDYYTIRFEKDAFQLVSRGKQEPEISWKVSRDYLEKVVENSDEYLEHPAKLDWDWLKSRLKL